MIDAVDAVDGDIGTLTSATSSSAAAALRGLTQGDLTDSHIGTLVGDDEELPLYPVRDQQPIETPVHDVVVTMLGYTP